MYPLWGDRSRHRIICPDPARSSRSTTLPPLNLALNLRFSLKMLEALKWHDMPDADPTVARRKDYDVCARQLCREVIAAAEEG